MTAARELPVVASGLTMEVVSITPAIAEKWLGKNVRNRHVRPKVVAHYAKTMTRGEWLVNGEAIKFSVSGDLLDGQHRLSAIIVAQKTIKSLVVRGLPTEAQDVLDIGAGRRVGDQLSIAGFPNATNLAAVSRLVIAYESAGDWKAKASVPQTLNLVSGNELLAYATHHAKIIHKGSDLRPSVAGATYYELMKVDDQKAQEFFERLTDGANLPGGSPILALRDRLRTLRNDRTFLPDEALFSLVFRTWNAWRTRRSLTSLPLYRNGELIQCPEPK